MPFWSPRRNTSAVTDGSTARDVAPALEPIRLFLADRQVQGLSFLPMSESPICSTGERSSAWCVDLLVAPPQQAGDPQRRVHRRKHRLVAFVGPYVVTGVAHIALGQDPEAYLLRTRQQFLPMTSAHVTSRVDGSIDEQLPVVILNVGNLTELRALLSPGEGA